jgi:hypothetical protein
MALPKGRLVGPFSFSGKLQLDVQLNYEALAQANRRVEAQKMKFWKSPARQKAK